MENPQGKFPEVPKLLKRYLKHPVGINRELIKKQIKPKDIELLRVSTRNTAQGVWVSPEFLYNNEWHKFVTDTPLMTIARPFTIHGMEIGNTSGMRSLRLKHEWMKWLKEYMKANKIKVKFEGEDKAAIKKAEKKEKKKQAELDEGIQIQTDELPKMSQLEDDLPPADTMTDTI